MNGLAQLGATLVGGTLRHAQALAGGDLSQVIRIELEDGRVAAVKNGPDPIAEAQMLEAIRASGASAPSVLAATDEALVMHWVDGGGSVVDAWSSLGLTARKLHETLHPEGRYGWHTEFAFGRLPIQNTWHEDWPGFWAENRLLPFVDALPRELADRLACLAGDLGNRIPRKPPASLLHGDLWTGNVMARGTQVAALIDPACYYGDGEVDIAMLQLFGNPTEAFFEQYGQPGPGAEERLAIYRLWPALVHASLFGSGYFGLVDEQLRIAGVGTRMPRHNTH